ncbi:MAG: 2-hydroxyacid dehydrogenase [Erysipelotrichaceae bacterium]|nr:2-hydroxyacid dehydrogenase [Erysipelotrichaceae bacterium]
MKKILFTNRYRGESLKTVREIVPEGFTIAFLSAQDQDTLKEEIADADYLLAGGRLRIDKGVLDRATRLKMIQRSGAGLDSLDLEAIKEKGLHLYVNKGINAESVAEDVLLLMLASLRRLTVIDQNTKNGIWERHGQAMKTRELRGKTVGIVGMGSVGKRLVELLRPFEVKILYCDIKRPDKDTEDERVLFTDVDDLLKRSDIVTLNCALTRETEGLLGREKMEMMKDGAILINTARGGLVDQEALIRALENKKISFAALDVHSEEPLSDDCPLKRFENVILTPHIAGITADSFRNMMAEAIRNIVCFDEERLEEIAGSRYL